MSSNPPGNPGTPDDNPSAQWEEMLRSFLGDQADDVIREMRERGIDPSSMPLSGLPQDPAALAPLLDQVRRMLENSSGGAVNSDVAHDVARQAARSQGDPSIVPAQERAVTQALSVAELWLDAATSFGPSGSQAKALDRSQWVELTLPAWQSLAEPIARSVADALAKILKDSLPDTSDGQSDPIAFQISGVPGMPDSMSGLLGEGGFTPEKLMHQIGAAVFGMQVGTAAGTLSREVFGTGDIGVPLTSERVTALLPANIEHFAEGLDVPVDEVRLFLALRESAHARLFAHVPWLQSHVYGLINAYARGITIDMDALEGSMRDIDPTNTEALQEALGSGVFSIQSTPEQQETLGRLETTLALIEGWVDEVVTAAALPHLPGTIALSEMIRRRRAAGGPAEQTFAALIGLELRPRRLRDAAALWAAITRDRGLDERENVWEHPDLLPTAVDLDDPAGFLSGRENTSESMSDLDAALAEIFSEAERNAGESSSDSHSDDAPDDDQGDAPSSESPSDR
ncbi:zinc-dependent metalloprotease [Jonesia quinghaiensis]|uniref:zinc-dependent metalloprotease n=1 Tax=Jonesia quinghaiensis TaxID=262806 RepID=UPI00040A5B6C|nr:zinc-dependent metalloprotease [Jonesia quinghaiensis]